MKRICVETGIENPSEKSTSNSVEWGTFSNTSCVLTKETSGKL